MTKRKKINQTLDLGYSVVAFMDLLGQQEFLRNLNSIPNSDDSQDMAATKEHLKNTYGAVTGMRSFFKDSFKAFSKNKLDLGSLNAKQRKDLQALTNNPIKLQNFSDSTVISMSLRTDTAKLPTRGIFGIFGAAATTFTCCLAAGHPIRGGIDVGLGMNITNNEIYGPALARAYMLESKIANYPRIVVGNELIRYLEVTKNQEPKNETTFIAKNTAARCIECLALDNDGYHFVDYLGKSYRRIFGEDIDVSVIQKAYKHVLNFSAKYQKEKNSKLAFRYTLLKNYFEDRLPIWEDLFSTEQHSEHPTNI